MIALAQQDTVFLRYNIGEYREPLNYKTDTVLYTSSNYRHIITGTSILPETYSQLDMRNRGYNFNRILVSGCADGSGYMDTGPPERVTSVTITDTSLAVEITIHSVCGSSFLVDGYINEKDSVLHLTYNTYGSWASCDCCYGLTYCFTRDNFWGGVKLDSAIKLKGVMIRDNFSTFKEIK